MTVEGQKVCSKTAGLCTIEPVLGLNGSRGPASESLAKEGLPGSWEWAAVGVMSLKTPLHAMERFGGKAWA